MQTAHISLTTYHTLLQPLKTLLRMVIQKMYMQTPNPNETPDLIEEKLAKFETGLNNVDEQNKEGDLMVKERCLDECGQSFKLAFLQCDVFNAKNAV